MRALSFGAGVSDRPDGPSDGSRMAVRKSTGFTVCDLRPGVWMIIVKRKGTDYTQSVQSVPFVML